MGTEYTFVCEDCKKYYDIGKDTTTIRMMPTLLKEHEGHSVLVYSEHEADLEAKYEGSNYPFKNIETGYAEENVWEENGLFSECEKAITVWGYNDFYAWYYAQKWHIAAYPPRKQYTPEERAERNDRTIKAVQNFYATLCDDLDDN